MVVHFLTDSYGKHCFVAQFLPSVHPDRSSCQMNTDATTHTKEMIYHHGLVYISTHQSHLSLTDSSETNAHPDRTWNWRQTSKPMRMVCRKVVLIRLGWYDAYPSCCEPINNCRNLIASWKIWWAPVPAVDLTATAHCSALSGYGLLRTIGGRAGDHWGEGPSGSRYTFSLLQTDPLQTWQKFNVAVPFLPAMVHLATDVQVFVWFEILAGTSEVSSAVGYFQQAHKNHHKLETQNHHKQHHQLETQYHHKQHHQLETQYHHKQHHQLETQYHHSLHRGSLYRMFLKKPRHIGASVTLIQWPSSCNLLLYLLFCFPFLLFFLFLRMLRITFLLSYFLTFFFIAWRVHFQLVFLVCILLPFPYIPGLTKFCLILVSVDVCDVCQILIDYVSYVRFMPYYSCSKKVSVSHLAVRTNQ